MASRGAGRPGGRGERRVAQTPWRGEGRGVPGGRSAGRAARGWRRRAAGGGAVALRAPAAALSSACPRVSQPLPSGAGGYGKRCGSVLGWPRGGRRGHTGSRGRADRAAWWRAGSGRGSGVGTAVPPAAGTGGPGSAAAPSHRPGAEAAGRGSALGGRPRLCALPAWGRVVPGGRRGRRVVRAGPARGPLAAGGASSRCGRPACCWRCPRGKVAAAAAAPALELRIRR